MESLFGLTVRSTLHSTTTNAETTGCTRRVVCVRVDRPVDRFGHVLCCAGCRWSMSLQRGTFWCCCAAALSAVGRPVGRAAGCGSRMRQQNATADGVGKSHDFGRNNERALRHGMHEFRARAARCCGRAWASGRLGSLNGSQEDDRSLLLTGGGAASRGRCLVARVMADQGDWGGRGK
jgi:hypothetical protein